MNFKLLLLVMWCLVRVHVNAQITSGKIVYERKTNLLKKYKDDDDMKEWIASEEKLKVDMFELYFTDSNSVFMPQESDVKEKMSWTTNKNVVYQKPNENKRLTVKSVWGEKVYVTDTLYKRSWKITDSKRVICGYSCRKAIWQANDSVRIYAWYCDEILTNVGPESFYGLPGAILGLATEDGGVIYFAKSVQQSKPNMEEVIPKTAKNKIYTTPELRAKLEKEFGKNKWGKQLIAEQFGLW
jgi:GLPGLI family protein